MGFLSCQPQGDRDAGAAAGPAERPMRCRAAADGTAHLAAPARALRQQAGPASGQGHQRRGAARAASPHGQSAAASRRRGANWPRQCGRIATRKRGLPDRRRLRRRAGVAQQVRTQQRRRTAAPCSCPRRGSGAPRRRRCRCGTSRLRVPGARRDPAARRPARALARRAPQRLRARRRIRACSQASTASPARRPGRAPRRLVQAIAPDAAGHGGHAAVGHHHAAIAAVERQHRQQALRAAMAPRKLALKANRSAALRASRRCARADGRCLPGAVRVDDHRRAQAQQRRRFDGANLAAPGAGWPVDGLDGPGLQHLRAGRPGLLQQQGVERLAAQRAAPGVALVIGAAAGRP